jgi:hypothetical protein
MSSLDMDRPRIRVDFNELAASDLVLLCPIDIAKDSEGNDVFLSEGLKVYVYEFNHYDDGEKEYLLADGVVEINVPEVNGAWTKKAKWCCRIDSKGIRCETTHDS